MQVTLSWYTVADLDQAKKFYGGILGLQQIYEMPGWVEFAEAKGAPAIGLAARKPESAPPAKRGEPQFGATVVLGVKDIEATCNTLRAKGVEFEGKIEEIPGVVKLATFRDPFENRLQLAQTLIGG